MFVYANDISGNICKELAMLVARGEKNWTTEGQGVGFEFFFFFFFTVCIPYSFYALKMCNSDCASVHWHVNSWLHYSTIAIAVCNVAPPSAETLGKGKQQVTNVWAETCEFRVYTHLHMHGHTHIFQHIIALVKVLKTEYWLKRLEANIPKC